MQSTLTRREALATLGSMAGLAALPELTAAPAAPAWQLATFSTEVTVPLAGQPVWERLEVGPEGSLAVFAVPWDDEHRWGVRVDAAGNVAEVIISP